MWLRTLFFVWLVLAVAGTGCSRANEITPLSMPVSPMPTAVSSAFLVQCTDDPSEIAVRAAAYPPVEPVFSPSVAFLALDRQPENAVYSIGRVDLDTGREQLLWTGSPDPPWLAPITWSPDGQWLVVGHWQGYSPQGVSILSNHDGTLLASVNKPDDGIAGVVWFPDSTRLLVLGRFAGHEPMTVVDRQLHTLIQVSHAFGDFRAFTWSPTGRQLAFDWHGRIHIMDPATGATVWQSASTCSGMTVEQVWSPDERWIARWGWGNGRYAHGSVCLDNTVTGETIYLEIENQAPEAIFSDANLFNPVWADSSRYLYFAATDFDPDHHVDPHRRLLRFDVEQRCLTRLADLPDSVPGWGQPLTISPDRQRLALPYWRAEGEAAFQIFALDGTLLAEWPLPVRLWERKPYAWSADGQQLLFLADPPPFSDYWSEGGPELHLSLFALDVVTGELKQLTEGVVIVEWAILSLEFGNAVH